MNVTDPQTTTGYSHDPVGANTLEVIARADKFNRWMYETIRPFLKGEILEIGSGIGNISKFAIADKHNITLSDYSPEYKQTLKKNFGHLSNVRDVLSIDLQHPDFFSVYRELQERFDTVFLLNVIEHLQDDTAAVEYCRFLLKPGGHLIVLAPAYQSLYCKFDKELGHFRRYTLKKLGQVIGSQAFELIHKQYFNTIGIFGWFIFGKIMNRKMIGSGEMSVFNSLQPVFKVVDNLTFHKAGLSAIVIGKKKAL